MMRDEAIAGADKQAVVDFWESAACGEQLYLSGSTYMDQAAARYRLEPYIENFARFQDWKGKRVLEIGVGLGADHQRFAEAGAELSGVDITERAVEHARRRFAVFGLHSDLRVADAERLPFADNTFDLVYSWGVIHHTPDTGRAAREIVRVLKPGGEYRVMIYHRASLVGLMLWLRHPSVSMAKVYARHLESPGTKAYSRAEAQHLFPGCSTRVQLTHGDLLESGAGQRHQGTVLAIARHIWPRFILRRLAKPFGLFLLIAGRK